MGESMDWLAGVLTNSCFLAAVTGWFVAQALKIPFTAIVTQCLADCKTSGETGAGVKSP